MELQCSTVSSPLCISLRISSECKYSHKKMALIAFPHIKHGMLDIGYPWWIALKLLLQIVFEEVMDGQKMKDIAKEIGVSCTRAQELKNKVVNNLAWAIYDEEKKKEMAPSWWERLFFVGKLKATKSKLKANDVFALLLYVWLFKRDMVND